MVARFPHVGEGKKIWLWIVGAVIVLQTLLRAGHLYWPAGLVFDEKYYVGHAQTLLAGGNYYYDHPFGAQLPYLIALWAGGALPAVWRMPNLLAGTALLIGLAWWLWGMTKSRLAVVAAVLLAAADSMLFVYGRLGLVDLILVTLMVWGWACLFAAERARASWVAHLCAAGAGIFLGHALTVKWFALGGWVWAGAWLVWRRWRRKTYPAARPLPGYWWVFWLGIVPPLLYLLWFIPLVGLTEATSSILGKQFFLRPCSFHAKQSDARPRPAPWWNRVVHWHCITWYNHAYNIKRTHPYQSQWWQWPLGQRPILIHREGTGAQQRQLWIVGNDLLWWLGAAAVLLAAVLWWWWKRGELTWLVLGALGFWLPWAGVSRLVFIYSFMPSLMFEIALLAILGMYAWRWASLRLILLALVGGIWLVFFLRLPAVW